MGSNPCFRTKIIFISPPAIFIATICYYAAFITRGTLSGNGRFGAYGLMHGSEGTVRILACGVLFAAGISTVGYWGLALAAPPIIAEKFAEKRWCMLRRLDFARSRLPRLGLLRDCGGSRIRGDFSII